MRAADGREAVERLYAEHADGLLGLLAYQTGNRALAEDIVADTFERVLRTRSDWRGGAEEKTWLYTIALNRMRDLARRHGAKMSAVERPAPVTVSAGETAAVADRDLLPKALQKLPDEERTVVALRFGGDLTLREIADLLGERETAIEGLLYRGLRRLRHVLGLDARLPEDVNDVAQRLTAARASFSPPEHDALRTRIARSSLTRGGLGRLRRKPVAALLTAALMLTSGAGAVIASSAIGGGAHTFDGTHFGAGAYDRSAQCQFLGRHEETKIIHTRSATVTVIISFDCHQFAVFIDYPGHFRYGFRGDANHDGDGSWSGDAPLDVAEVTVSAGGSTRSFPFNG